jgi:PKD repeat protein
MKFLSCAKTLVILLTICIASCQKAEEDSPAPIASFNVSKSSAVLNEVVTFTNTSQNATTYEWNFGDGNTSTIKDPTHSYSITGSFTITLSATGKGGNNLASKSITVISPVPVASFTTDKATAEVGEAITFTNTSQNATSYLWDFGDGSTSTDENSTHSYTTAGTFTISLSVTGDGGTNTSSINITILFPAPIASFTMDKTTAYTGEIVMFTNTSQFATSYSWNFGDNETSTEMNPSHSYSNTGSYTITLTATGEGGNNSTTKTIEITVPEFNFDGDWQGATTESSTEMTSADISFTVSGNEVTVTDFFVDINIGHIFGNSWHTTLNENNTFSISPTIGSLVLKFAITLESSTSGTGVFTYNGNDYDMEVSKQ